MSKKIEFEASIERLDEILKILETNEKSLDETINLFEEGLKLADNCDKQLKVFEEKIESLINQKGIDNENN
ncbi:MAG: exodeoxyribonuclease VII small subunit [Anaerorhabdus sp.]